MSYRAILLCAGIGNRLRPLTKKIHKSLLPIGDKMLVEHILDTIVDNEIDINTVHIVIGHYAYKWRDLLGSQYRSLEIRYLINPLYKVTGASSSLYIASRILKNHPCLIMEADHYMHPKLMKMLFDKKNENAILTDKTHDIEFYEEVMGYGLNGILTDIIWPVTKDSPKKNCLGEAMTVFKLSKKTSYAYAVILENYLLEKIPVVIKEIVEPLNRLIKQEPMYYVDVDGLPWIEIDFPSDYEKAKKMKFE